MQQDRNTGASMNTMMWHGVKGVNVSDYTYVIVSLRALQ
jgi:hypothetical protein